MAIGTARSAPSIPSASPPRNKDTTTTNGWMPNTRSMSLGASTCQSHETGRGRNRGGQQNRREEYDENVLERQRGEAQEDQQQG